MALKRAATKAFATLFIFALAATIYEAFRYVSARAFNQDLEKHLYLRAGTHRSDYGALAKGFALHRAEKFDAAAPLYVDVVNRGSPALQTIARFNLATSYLQRAHKVDPTQATAKAEVATPLVELAKEDFRRLLAIDADHWPSKVNLEMALRLAPDAFAPPPERMVTPERTPRAPDAPAGFGGLP